MNNRLWKMLAAAALGLGLALCPAPAWAQATGQITGVVTDNSGGVVPGATVEVTNQATGLGFDRMSASVSRYRLGAAKLPIW